LKCIIAEDITKIGIENSVVGRINSIVFIEFDGDYYQARWNETGVLEADCMICHLPVYNNTERKKQLKSLNFRWAPTSAAGLGTIDGSIADNKPVRVSYNTRLFDKDGKLSPHIVREPHI